MNIKFSAFFCSTSGLCIFIYKFNDYVISFSWLFLRGICMELFCRNVASFKYSVLCLKMPVFLIGQLSEEIKSWYLVPECPTSLAKWMPTSVLSHFVLLVTEILIVRIHLKERDERATRHVRLMHTLHSVVCLRNYTSKLKVTQSVGNTHF